MFKKATKEQAKLRLALCGPSGSGKTFTSLNLARCLGDNIALIDTERGSASKYADRFSFDVCELEDFHPGKYIEAIREAGKAKYDVIVVDSLTHAWFWELNQANSAQNSFTAWGKIRPLERALIDVMLSSPADVIVTMRTKTEWVLVESPKSGKPIPERIGTAPIQASGIEYEFDVSGQLDLNHVLNITKSRCPALMNTTHANPGEDLADVLINWLDDGAPAAETAESKAIRIKEARERVGLDQASVRNLMKTEFDGKSSPRQLSPEECDRLISLIHQLAA